MATSKPQGTFHDAITGETITRDLTPEEIALLPKPTEDEK
jgi:hypothetical protein